MIATWLTCLLDVLPAQLVSTWRSTCGKDSKIEKSLKRVALYGAGLARVIFRACLVCSFVALLKDGTGPR